MQRLDGSTTLATGLRLRLRMPQAADAPRLRALLHALGLAPADELAVSRLLRFDPRERTAAVAVALVDRSEVIVGIAAMDRFADAPDLVLADEEQAPGAGAVLEAALRAYGERTSRIA